MKEFVVRSSLTAGIVGILSFALLIGLVLLFDEATVTVIFPGNSSFAIFLTLAFVGIVWALIGAFLSSAGRPKKEYTPEQTKTQHTTFAVIFFMGAAFALLSGAFIPAIIMLIGAAAEWYNRERKK